MQQTPCHATSCWNVRRIYSSKKMSLNIVSLIAWHASFYGNRSQSTTHQSMKLFAHFRAWNLWEIGKLGKIRTNSVQNIPKPPGRLNRANSITLKFCIKRRISLTISLARWSRSTQRVPSWRHPGTSTNDPRFCCILHNINILEITKWFRFNATILWIALTTLESFSSSAPWPRLSNHLSMTSFTTRHSLMNLLMSCKFTVTASVINFPHAHRFWLRKYFSALIFFIL